jgi:hypothetical protein
LARRDSFSRGKDLDRSLSDRVLYSARERGAIRPPALLGGKPGGKIVKRRARRVVVRLADSLVVTPRRAGSCLPERGRDPGSMAPAWPPQSPRTSSRYAVFCNGPLNQDPTAVSMHQRLTGHVPGSRG